jgi:hypothetical protein
LSYKLSINFTITHSPKACDGDPGSPCHRLRSNQTTLRDILMLYLLAASCAAAVVGISSSTNSNHRLLGWCVVNGFRHFQIILSLLLAQNRHFRFHTEHEAHRLAANLFRQATFLSTATLLLYGTLLNSPYESPSLLSSLKYAGLQ